MAGTTLDIDHILSKDHIACRIADYWVQWDSFRQQKKTDWREIRQYIFATDTTTTTNAQLPWKNKTTLPKLTQIRDNLHANYMASVFPRRKWLYWEGDHLDDQSKTKVSAIENYTQYLITRPEFKKEISKVLLDYIDMGNAFVMPEWCDMRTQLKGSTGLQTGFVGPRPVRISPLDIVFNPTAPNFEQSPKIIRSLMTLGELRSKLEQITPGDDQNEIQELFNYLSGIRQSVWSHSGATWTEKDHYLRVDGYQSFVDYLKSDFCEILTFYGDLYDVNNNVFYKNKIITIADRHKLISIKDNPTAFGTFPIFHVGWRIRQDNLWAMGPLDNLVGMQYRLDHIENMKSDLLDLILLPPLKIKGFVHDFEWGPMARIFMQDPESDVEMLEVDSNPLQANMETSSIQNTMEEMAGSPKEAMGFRTPGEKTAYEVQRLENAAARIFSSKVVQFEEQLIEPLLNSMLDLAQRFMDETTVSVFDNELKIYDFQSLTRADITGTGRIRPVAARNFAERADKIQNLTNFYSSAIAADPEIKAHLSSVKIAQMIEDLLDLDDYGIVTPYIRLSEQAEAQALMNTQMEQVEMQNMTPAGIAQDDSDQPMPMNPMGPLEG